MSAIGSLGLDSTLRYFMQGTNYLMPKVMVAPSRVTISTAPCCTKKLLCKKYALLKKTEQPKSSKFLPVHQLRAHYYCTTTYCTTAVWSVRTANNAAIRA